MATKRTRNLVVVRAGDDSLHPAWLAGPEATDIRVATDIGTDAAEVLAQKPLPPLWIALAAAAAALAIIEWCLYQRRWTC